MMSIFPQGWRQMAFKLLNETLPKLTFPNMITLLLVFSLTHQSKIRAQAVLLSVVFLLRLILKEPVAFGPS